MGCDTFYLAKMKNQRCQKERAWPVKITPKKPDNMTSNQTGASARKLKRRGPKDAFPVTVKVPSCKPLPPPHEVFQMLDSVKIKRDIPGTSIKKGMQGAVVDLFGTPPRAANVEFISPPSIEDIDVEDLELVRRY